MTVYKVVWNFATPIEFTAVSYDRTFLSEGAAERFRDSLKEASQLLRVEGRTNIYISKVEVET